MPKGVLKYLKDVIENQESYLDTIWALKKDVGMLVSKDSHSHQYDYKFDDIAEDSFTDMVAIKIAQALEESKKTTGLTLFHGDVSDRGMGRIMKALQKTTSPISRLEIKDFPKVTDKSLKVLPDIIKEKGILFCNVELTSISKELKNQINNACANNLKMQDELAKRGRV